MNRSRTRSSAFISGAAALGLALVTALTGCSAGQISQTAVQEPAVNGTGTIVGSPESGIALRNVHIRAPQSTDYVQPGQTAELIFVAINESAAEKDKLVSITSDYATVKPSGSSDIPPGGTLIVGTPDDQPSPLDSTEAANTGEAKLTLTKPITNGVNYPFTFTFQRSGSVTLQVPISAGKAPRREVPGAVEAAEPDTGAHH